jgi:NADH-quinone oxidoreductase subunit J
MRLNGRGVWSDPFVAGGFGPSMEATVFWVLGAITLVSAFFVVIVRRPIHNVLFMILTMIGLAGLFIMLQAEFVAMVQLIVYAGAVMVLFLFVIMLLNLDEMSLPYDPRGFRWWIGIGMALALAVMLFPVLKAVLPAGEPGATALAKTGLSNTELIGRELFTSYLLPFEVASVLLLAAIIGAVVLVKKRD